MQAVITSTVTRFILLLGTVFFAWTSVYAFKNTVGWTGSPLAAASLVLTAGIGILAIAYGMYRFLSRTQALILILIMAAGLRLGWIVYVDTQPVSDFLDMYSAARSTVLGDLSFGTSEYFTRWVYQLGFTMYEALLLQLFGDHLIVLKVFNVLFNTATVALIYISTSRVFGEWCARAASLSFALYVPQIMMCSVLTNQHISTFFFFLGLYFAVRDQGELRTGRWVLVGLFLGLANLMRPLGSAFIAAYLAFVVLYELMPKRVESDAEGHALAAPGWKLLLRAVGVVIVYGLVQQAASLSLQASGVTPYPLANPEPYYKFMVGVNPATNGGWSLEDNAYVTQYALGEERNEATKRLLLERVEDKKALLELLLRKLTIMWGNEDSAYMWSLWQQDRPELQRLSIQAERVGYLLMSLFGFIGMLSLLLARQRVRNMSSGYLLYVILILGYALIHVAIEIQTRYRMDIMPALFLVQSLGMYKLLASAGLIKNRGIDS